MESEAVLYHAGMIFHFLKLKNMKRILPLLMVMLILLNSCTVVGGIFKAGVWVGIFIVAVIIGVIIWLVTRRSGN